MAKVQIIIGSKSDMEHAQKAQDQLREFGIEAPIEVASAHRAPQKVVSIVESSDAQVFIAMAGLAAALPGFVAAHTIKPVIAVPLDVKVGGLDALLASMQMPTGVPVAAVAIDGAKNAGILAAEIIALNDSKVAGKIKELRISWARQ
ncbi:MAG TPA: 5-(carboxyamino)imidazole ribonucleotide mutase [Candidatus Micrarchaeota archaeon]|nr:5-(carboxyamino)imidazole ribonucleotide mutase [Candidatus Micrarchaeota archaeon]